MKASIDFLDVKTVFRYVIAFAIVLAGGALLKDLFAVIITVFILYYAITRNLFRCVELWLIWFFSIGFYLGQGYIENAIIQKYITKPSFLLLVIFFAFYSKIPTRYRTAGYLVAWGSFLLISFIGLMYHDQSPFVLITVSSFFFIYLLLTSREINFKESRKLLNLFMSVAVLQTIICILQISKMIPPPSTMMDDGTGGQMEWVAGLDDVASGTFGPMASHIVSWYAAFIILFCVLMWSVCRKKGYLIIALIAVIQFATVDSKTIIGVTIAMMLYMLYHLNKHRFKLRLNVQKIFSIIVFMAITGFVLFEGIDFYYRYQNQEGGAINRANLSDVYEKEVKESRNIIMDNIGDWGKIQGFRYVFNDYLYDEPLNIFWGYGLLGYTFNGKMSLIESKDTRVMQMNNFTRSRSGLISIFSQSGFIGFALFFAALLMWYKYNIIKKHSSRMSFINNGLLTIFFRFTLLAAFVSSVVLTSLTVISFAAVIGLIHRYSELDMLRQKTILHLNNNSSNEA